MSLDITDLEAMQKIVAENKSGFHIRGQITLFYYITI